MRNIIFLLGSILFSCSVFSQNLDTIFNSKKQIYRIIHIEYPIYILQYKYFSDGSISTIDSSYYPENQIAGSLNDSYNKVWIFDKKDKKSLKINYYTFPKSTFTKEFYYDDKPVFVENYIAGKKDGKSTYFYNDGELYYYVYYFKGKKHGQAVDKKGSVILYFSNDKLLKAIFYDENYSIFSEQIFSSDEKKELIYYDQNGKEIARYSVNKGNIKLNKNQKSNKNLQKQLSFIEHLMTL